MLGIRVITSTKGANSIPGSMGSILRVLTVVRNGGIPWDLCQSNTAGRRGYIITCIIYYASPPFANAPFRNVQRVRRDRSSRGPFH